MDKISGFIRSIILVAMVVVCAFLCGLRLLRTQIVDGEGYLNMTKATYVSEQDIDAARGQIVDCKGKVLQSNKIVYNISLQYTTLPKDKARQNEIIYRVLSVLINNGEEWNDSLPISETKPYLFVAGKDKAIETLKQRLNIANYATVDDCIYQLYEMYEISDKYDEQMRRYIAGVRYEMTIKDFSYRNKFVLASDISLDTVMELKELSNLLDGVDITESWERQYLEGDIAPHLRGTVGAISPEQYAQLKDSGYTFNDCIGLSGIEKALEDELRGTRGVRSITRSHDGKEISDEITTQPVAGNSVMLTLDSDFQRLVQDALEYHVKFQQTEYCNPEFKENPELLNEACRSGAVVVVDVKTGGVLAAASYPNYDLNEYVEDYSKVISAEGSPVFNRTLDGVFRPGSTFKTITACAGLSEGVIGANTTISCGGVYTYYAPGFMPTCLGAHGALNVRTALRHSCNIFFYETARRMGIDKLSEWAGKFGVGKDLNFELSMKTGQMTSLELYDKLGLHWNPGDIVQAGIGQSETGLTPLHMAVQAMTLANKGVRLQPHIVKSVYNYDFTEKYYEKEVVVAEDFSDYPGMASNMEVIKEGMLMVSETLWATIPEEGYFNVLDYVGVGKGNVAVKTGTPQVSETVFNSALVGYYPAENPEIAFGIIIERGDRAWILGANVISAYAQGKISRHYDENGVPCAWL
ncbi:MAG: peptidoglycan D,D-transpeptidase FtsI family protein [Oscillospiraceae bacterium]